MRFVCIDDDVPVETISLLRGACERKDVSFELCEAATFDYLPEQRLRAGDLLYNPATSWRSEAVERHLYVPGVIGLRADPLGPFSAVYGTPDLFHSHGLPVPRYNLIGAVVPEFIREVVADLGGLPVVIKVPGGSGGVGVIRADSFPSLVSTLEFLVSKGVLPMLSSYIASAVCWRVVVLGGRAIAACRNPVPEYDFRSGQSTSADDYIGEVPSRLEALAVKAIEALRLEFGGVDILEHTSGRLYLLEANFPCYFAPAEEVGGMEVSDRIVEHMLAKRATQAANQVLSRPGAT